MGGICSVMKGRAVPAPESCQYLFCYHTAQCTYTVHGELAPAALPSLLDFGDVVVFCVHFVIIQPAAAAGIARSSQQSSSLPGQAVQYDMAGDTARPSQ
jgi:hypothetical protein